MLINIIFFTLSAVLTAFGSVRSEVATQVCKSQLDCLPTHCCTKRFMNPLSYCVPRRRLNELCIWDDVGTTMIDGVYDITCPCEADLKCTRELYTAPNGVVLSRGNARCREPNYPGFQYYANSNSYAGSGYSSNSYAGRGYSSNSYANSEAYGSPGNWYANSYGYRR